MNASKVPDKLDRVPIEEVPRGRLYRLNEPISVDGKPILDTDQYLIVRTPEELSFDVRIIIEAARDRVFVADVPVCDADKVCCVKTPLLAYMTLYFRDIAMMVLVANDIHRGAGRSIWTGQLPVGVPPLSQDVKDLRPSPITAERVMPVSCKTQDLPRDCYLVLASSYFQSSAYLTEVGDDNSDVKTSPIFDMLLLKRGELITLSEKDGKLFCTKGQDEFEISPDCELHVSIPGSGN